MVGQGFVLVSDSPGIDIPEHMSLTRPIEKTLTPYSFFSSIINFYSEVSCVGLRREMDGASTGFSGLNVNPGKPSPTRE